MIIQIITIIIVMIMIMIIIMVIITVMIIIIMRWQSVAAGPSSSARPWTQAT